MKNFGEKGHLRSPLPKGHPHTPGRTWRNFGETRCGKSGVLEQKSGNISETRRDRGKVTIGLHEVINALSNSNGTIRSRPPIRPPLPRVKKVRTANLANTTCDHASEQKRIQNFGEKAAWAYPETDLLRHSYTSSVCLSVCHIQVCFSHRLEYFENIFTAEYIAYIDPNVGDLVQREYPPPQGWNIGGVMSTTKPAISLKRCKIGQKLL